MTAPQRAEPVELTVPADHPSLPGHFPGRPIVPGVLILDLVLTAIEAAYGPIGALRLPQVKFVRPLLPGETTRVVLDAVSASDAGALTNRWRFQVLRDDQLLASGEVVATPDQAAHHALPTDAGLDG